MNNTMQAVKNRTRHLSKQDQARVIAMSKGSTEEELITLAALAVTAVRALQFLRNQAAAIGKMERVYRAAMEAAKAADKEEQK